MILKQRKINPLNRLCVVFEVHSLGQAESQRIYHNVLRQADGLVAITHALKNDLVDTLNLSPDRIYVAPDGVQDSLLQRPDTQSARKETGLPADRTIVMYTGQLYKGKGADTFLNAAAHADADTVFVLVGGSGTELSALKRKVNEQNIRNVIFTGHVEPRQVSLYQTAADVLVLPPTDEHVISPYTSPLKLFEYMASQKPIVASDLPVLKEILTDGENAVLFRQGSAESLNRAIRTLFADPQLAARISQRAYQDVRQYTWSKRAKDILQFIHTLNAVDTL